MMKKLFISAIALMTFAFTTAQETKFGAKAGIDLATAKVKIAGTTAKASETGFYIGGFANIGISEKFAVQPELLYVSVKDLNFISLPILADYSISNEFGLYFGPSLNYFLDETDNQLKINLDLGVGYEVSEEFEANAKYSFGVGNVTVSGLFIGGNYTF
jgi:Outer membrane protein beta-barrel domain